MITDGEIRQIYAEQTGFDTESGHGSDIAINDFARAIYQLGRQRQWASDAEMRGSLMSKGEMQSMNYTHQKRPYRAHVVQWLGYNTKDIEKLFPPPVEVLPYGEHLMIRFSPGEIQCMKVGWYAVRGENGEVKCYADAQFRTKYEEIVECACKPTTGAVST